MPAVCVECVECARAREWSVCACVCVCACAYEGTQGTTGLWQGHKGPRRYRNAVDPQASRTLFLFSVKRFPFHCSFASTSWSVSDQVAGLCPKANRQQV